MRLIGITATLLSLTACGNGSDHSEDEKYSSEESATDISDYDGVEKGDETYDEYDERRDGYAGAYGTYEGDGCTVDCSGHDAGYNWAQENGIDDPDNCGGNSWSFEEGCRSYAEENTE